MSLDAVSIPGEVFTVDGEKTKHEIFLFVLSTCGWCKKGKKWLSDNGYAYNYVNVNHLSLEVRNKLKEELKKEFNLNRVVFPLIVVDRSQTVLGLQLDQWEGLLA